MLQMKAKDHATSVCDLESFYVSSQVNTRNITITRPSSSIFITRSHAERMVSLSFISSFIELFSFMGLMVKAIEDKNRSSHADPLKTYISNFHQNKDHGISTNLYKIENQTSTFHIQFSSQIEKKA